MNQINDGDIIAVALLDNATITGEVMTVTTKEYQLRNAQYRGPTTRFTSLYGNYDAPADSILTFPAVAVERAYVKFVVLVKQAQVPS